MVSFDIHDFRTDNITTFLQGEEEHDLKIKPEIMQRSRNGSISEESSLMISVAVRVCFSTFRARADSLHAKTNAHVPGSPKVRLIAGKCVACCVAFEVASCHCLRRRICWS